MTTALQSSAAKGAEPSPPGADAPVLSGLDARRHDVIDALRGAAILLVILLHLQIRIRFEDAAISPHLPRAVWRLFFSSGTEAVRIFFVISGFLITTTSLRRWNDLAEVDVKQFFQLRFARIAPTLLALLVTLAVLHFLGVADYTVDRERVSYARALLAALTFHVIWLEAARSMYLPASWDVLWSLSVEEIFYLLFPLGCRLLRWPLGARALLFGLVVTGAWVRVALVDQPMWQSKAYLACMDGIALGCLVALLTHGKVFSRRAVGWLAATGGALALAVLLWAKAPAFGALSKLRLHHTILSFATAALLVAGIRLRLGSIGSRLLRPLIACGRLSYEMYLTHMFVVLTAVTWFFERGKPAALAYPLLGLVILGTWGLGWLVERYVSAPANRWLRGAFRAENPGTALPMIAERGATALGAPPPTLRR
jgi:peptidoglycan/LPS O-acetylase OafA/YrhL